MDKLTPVVLVKNEEYFLPYTLESVAGYFDRMVIYDVGSTDRTREIIEWYVEKEKGRTEFFTRFLPDCPPEVQGTFRNSMIAEATSDYYLILDGDELYPKQMIDGLKTLANKLDKQSMYGVVRRQEVTENLSQGYTELRTHHRVYHRSAYWTHTHPGEIPAIPQKSHREIHDDTIICYHMHNALRSSKEAETHKRIARKSQRTYHPGNILRAMNLLEEVPILKSRIENFPVCPALEKLWETQR